MHGPAEAAPAVTNRYAVCGICGAQWQLQSAVNADARTCRFCGATAERIRIHSEAPRRGAS